MFNRFLPAYIDRSARYIRALLLCPVLSAFCSVAVPGTAAPVEAESLGTGVVPTMGINDVSEGSLLFKTNQQGRFAPAPILKTDVRIAVTGIVARTTVRQEFRNPNHRKGGWLEGIYVFPLPEAAAVDHLRMHVGERIIEGLIKERSEAKTTYEQAKQEGKRTSLVEQERANIFTTSVANIGPDERITVEIEYQETIRYDSGQFQLRFPMAVGRRYIAGTPVIIEQQAPKGTGTMLDTDRVPDASRITPPVQAPNRGWINPLSLSLTLQPGIPVSKVESPYHPIIVVPDADGGFQITLKEDVVPANRDFQLVWHPAPRSEPVATILTEQKNGETYALLMLAPPTEHDDKMTSPPRDLTFIIDTSGSMAGPSIVQAKASLTAALTRLTTRDRFNIIQFNNTVRSLFPSLVPVTAASISKAIRYTEHLSADGGTEIASALRQALKSPSEKTRIQQIVLLTDGQVGNEEELFELLHLRVGTRRLFTIGIGSSPNTHLMRKTAELGRGSFTYIGNVTEVKEKLDALFKKLEHPVFTDIAFDTFGAVVEQYPPRIADLYEGEPIVIALKAGSLPQQAMVKGSSGDQPWSLPVSFKAASFPGGLSGYWAREKISALMDDSYTGTVEEAIRKAVLDVALTHHLVGKYTSLVAVDVTPARPTDKAMEPGQPENHANRDEQVSIDDLAKGATSGQLQIFMGLAAITVAWLLWSVRQRVA
jgi:Ca-activated chloride channel family protein